MKAAPKNKHSYWMVKQEPRLTAWDDFVRDGSTDWSACETTRRETTCAR
jgi:predicted RNA-binding protein with PUA-like domain